MKEYKEEICSYIDDIEKKSKQQIARFYEELRSSKYVCLFGAGVLGKAVALQLLESKYKVDFFVDNNEQLWNKPIIGDIKCISVEEMKIHKNDILVLVTTGYFKEICVQLKKLGINNYHVITQIKLNNNYYLNNNEFKEIKKNICNLIDILHDDKSKEIAIEIAKNYFKLAEEYAESYPMLESKDQYFPNDIIKLSEEEVFVDAGSFDGDTTRAFLARTQNQFKKIIAYELDKNNYEKLVKNVSKMNENIKSKIFLYNIGLYDENQEIKYASNTTSSFISANDSEEGSVVKISDHINGENVTFIKMDIEGSEVKALHGAKTLIKENKPKLAICIYHEPQHLWEIPMYLKSIVPEYRIFIRHHDKSEFETVCYAVI